MDAAEVIDVMDPAAWEDQPTIFVPGRPLTMNAERSQRHWTARSRDVAALRREAMVRWREGMANQHWPRIVSPFVVVARPYYPNRRGLPDPGSCFPTVKAIVDGARDARLIVDDTAQHVAAHLEMACVVDPLLDVPEMQVVLVAIR